MSAAAEQKSEGSARPLRWSAHRPGQAAIAYALSYLLLAAGGGVLAARITSPLVLIALVTALAAAAMALSLLLVLSVCRLSLSPGGEVVSIFAMIVVFCLVRPSVFVLLGRWLGRPQAGIGLADLLSVIPHQELLGNIALILWAAFLGRLVSRIIREGKLLLPVAVVASLGDTITVFWGFVAHVSKTAPEVAQTFSASAPVQPPPGLPAPILSAVGIGDFLFLALFLAVALRHSMQAPKALWAALVLTLLAPLFFLIWPQAPGLPGLPFISAAVLWANWRHLEFTRDEKRALILVGALVLAAALALWAVLRR